MEVTKERCIVALEVVPRIGQARCRASARGMCEGSARAAQAGGPVVGPGVL